MDAARAPLATASRAGAVTAGQVWAWLDQVPDPEIPVISIVDLGIVRKVEVLEGGACELTITPTYSGCPAMAVIAQEVRQTLRRHGVEEVRLLTQLSPAWTTDWLSDVAKRALKSYGIAPPTQHAIDISALSRGGRRGAPARPVVACPQCGSSHTEALSQFGSTPCKALYRCLDCREPFDYFKCH